MGLGQVFEGEDVAVTGPGCGLGCTWVEAPVLLREQQVGSVRLEINMGRAHARLWGLAIAFLIAALVAYALTFPLMRRMRERVRGVEAQLRYLAHFDPVTRLHNRNAFNALLEEGRARGERLRSGQRGLDDIGVESSAEALVGIDHHDQMPLIGTGAGEQFRRTLLACDLAGEAGHHAGQPLRIGACSLGCGLRFGGLDGGGVFLGVAARATPGTKQRHAQQRGRHQSVQLDYG